MCVAWSVSRRESHDFVPTLHHLRLQEIFVSIFFTRIATDISNQILSRAREGKFSQLEVNRGLPAPLLLKHFEKQGLVWQIKPLLRSSIEFRKLNLIDNWPPMPKMDVVFLRNVLIYFDVETKRKILGEVRKLLNPDGFLFLGAAEMPMSIDNAFERIDYPRSGCYKLRQT
mgnify:CR=1 FL=1